MRPFYALFTVVAILTCFPSLGGQEPPNDAQKRANRCTRLRCPYAFLVALSCYAVPHFDAVWAQGAEWLWKMAEEQGSLHSATKAAKASMKLV